MKLFSKKSADDPPRRRQHAGDERRERALERAQESQTTFLRNRTLTGSLSTRVSSANELNSDLQSARTQAHHLSRQRRRLTGALVGTIVVIVVLCALLFDLTVRPVIASTDQVSLDSARYEYAIKEYLAQRPIERLRIALDQQRLAEYLHQTVPEVESVQQDGNVGFGATEFRLTMRQPIAGWIIGGKQYFVDAKGVSFDKNYFETPEVNVVDQSGVQQSAGTAIASSRFLTFVGRIVSESKQQGLIVKEAIIPAGTTRQLQIKLQGRVYPIKLSLDRPVGEQVEDMKRAVGYFDKQKWVPEYVDIRVSGKAYYK